MLKPGWKTTEHALIWCVILLAIFLLARGHTADGVGKALSGPSLAAGLYALGRGIAKGSLAKGSGSFPFDLAAMLRRTSCGTASGSRPIGAPPASADPRVS